MPRFMPNERQADCSSLGRRGERGPDLAGGGEQLGGLGADDREVLILGGGGILDVPELHHLALGNDGGGRGQDFQRPQRSDLDHHLEGLAEQEVADQHAGLIAPEHAGSELAAPHLALVNDIVMQQRGRVHELDGSRQLDMTVAGIARELGHGERQHRTQALAAR